MTMWEEYVSKADKANQDAVRYARKSKDWGFLRKNFRDAAKAQRMFVRKAHEAAALSAHYERLAKEAAPYSYRMG